MSDFEAATINIAIAGIINEHIKYHAPFDMYIVNGITSEIGQNN